MDRIPMSVERHTTHTMRNACVLFVILMFLSSMTSASGDDEVTTEQKMSSCPRGWTFMVGFCVRQRRSGAQDCQTDGAEYIAGICIKRSRKENKEVSHEKTLSSEGRDTRFCCVGGYGK